MVCILCRKIKSCNACLIISWKAHNIKIKLLLKNTKRWHFNFRTICYFNFYMGVFLCGKLFKKVTQTEVKKLRSKNKSLFKLLLKAWQWPNFHIQLNQVLTYLFSCRLRRLLTAVCGHKYFDYVVLFFILISCVVLALEEPNIPSDDQVRTQSNNENCVIC